MHVIHVEKGSPYWRGLNLPAAAVYLIANPQDDIRETLVDLLGDHRDIEQIEDVYYWKCCWKFETKGDWSLISPPKTRNNFSLSDSQRCPHLVLWNHTAVAKVKLIIEKILAD